jgi:hypothetical protein
MMRTRSSGISATTLSRALVKVVLPDPVPPPMRMFWWVWIASRSLSRCRAVRIPLAA